MNELNLDNYAEIIVGDIQLSIITDVKQIAQDALIDALNKTVYLRQNAYRQTKDLLGAVEVSDMKIGPNMATFSVIINASKLSIEIRDGQLNAHAGVDGGDFREHIAGVLDMGTEGYGSPSPIYNHPAYGFFDMAADDMDKNMVIAMADALRGKGYKVEIY